MERAAFPMAAKIRGLFVVSSRRHWFALLAHFGTAEMDAAPGEHGTFSMERVQHLRKAVHAFLQQANVYDSIREIVDSYIADHPEESVDPHSSSDVLKIVREKGLVRSLLARLQQEQGPNALAIPTDGNNFLRSVTGVAQPPALHQAETQGSRIGTNWMAALPPGQHYLHVRLAGGRAFLENIDISPAVAKSYQLVVAVQFGAQRFRSSPQPCIVDPMFTDDLVLHVDKEPFGGLSSELVDVATPLHIAVLRESRHLDCAKLVGENMVDWRRVLKTGFLGLTVELSAENLGVPAGIIELQVELLPGGGPRYAEDDIASKIDHQRASIIAADREFLVYARRWWAEFQALRPAHQHRRVKVFASASNGRMVPVTHFVSPQTPDRSIDSPLAAARFVSLFGLFSDDEQTGEVLRGAGESAGGKGLSTWQSMFSFLSQRRGEQCNHATLLCSLLLGFGMDAYCAIGTEREGKTHMFVLTRLRQGPPDQRVLFWEPTTGDRFTQTGAHPYTSIGCVFNDKSFYANIQGSDSAIACAFDLDNEQLWKPLNVLKLRMVPKFPNPPLLWVPMNARLIEWELEMALMKVLGDHRDAAIGVPTRFDDGLSSILTQALSAYESQRVSSLFTTNPNGDAMDMSLFQACVKGKIGEGKTFRGIPLNVSHIDEHKIIAALLHTGAGKEIVELVGDDLKFALRVKVSLFPEGVVSVWVMLAATYRVDMTAG